MKKLNKKGFTIVELVIVIGVIAILAAVLIPTFSGIIEKANQSKVEQKAASLYKIAYALDLADGKLDGNDGETAIVKITDGGKEYAVTYTVKDGAFKTFSYTEDKYVATFDGSDWDVAETTSENDKK